MKWYGYAVIGAGVLLYVACARAQVPAGKPSCAERFANVGIPDTDLHGGKVVRFRGYPAVTVQIGEDAQAVCDRADKARAQEESVQNELAELRSQKKSAEDKLAQAMAERQSSSEIDFLVNHVVRITNFAYLLGGALFAGWIGLFIGIGIGKRTR